MFDISSFKHISREINFRIVNLIMIKSRNAALAEESAEVEVLSAEVAKFENISKRIKASLSRLENGAEIVKDSMGPVYSNTQNLQIMNDSRQKRTDLTNLIC